MKKKSMIQWEMSDAKDAEITIEKVCDRRYFNLSDHEKLVECCYGGRMDMFIVDVTYEKELLARVWVTRSIRDFTVDFSYSWHHDLGMSPEDSDVRDFVLSRVEETFCGSIEYYEQLAETIDIVNYLEEKWGSVSGYFCASRLTQKKEHELKVRLVTEHEEDILRFKSLEYGPEKRELSKLLKEKMIEYGVKTNTPISISGAEHLVYIYDNHVTKGE